MDSFSGTMTYEGSRYIAQKAAALEPVKIVKFVLANVPGIVEGQQADPGYGLPSNYVVVEKDVIDKPNYNDDDAVTWSLVLGAEEGDYDFNFWGVVTDTGALLGYQWMPTVKKRVGFSQVINRNLVLPFKNAKFLTGADIPVQSWQFNYEAEMDALQLQQAINSVSQLSLMNARMAHHERLLKLEGKL